ncbi:MAG: ferritin-like domain-containing protein [bacterium]|nr:ferritin-like domain-containing protein [bacterium]
MYCEDDPANAVDPSGHLPTWRDVKEWITEHGRTIAKGVGTVIGVVTGIKIAEEIYITYVNMECSRRMRKMLEDWGRAEEHPELQDLINHHIRDSMRDIERLTEEAARQIYRVRPVSPE